MGKLASMLGFYHNHNIKTVSEPVQELDGFKYDVKIVSKSYYWFFIKVWTSKKKYV